MAAVLHELSPRDRAALDALRRAGTDGLTKAEFVALTGSASGGAIAALRKRLVSCGHSVRTVFLERVGRIDEYRYVLVPDAGAAPSSVVREVTGDLGLGGTAGARVSVARVSFIDGAAA